MNHSALTVREAAHLAGVSTRRIEKSVEEGIVPKTAQPSVPRGRSAAHVPAQAVAYWAALRGIEGMTIAPGKKRRIWSKLWDTTGERLGEVELAAGLRLALDETAGPAWRRALDYLRARDAYLASDPAILGGEPVIRGTRITCRSVAARLKGGETLADLAADYPEIPRAAFEAADIYARTHPPRGRPRAATPWRGD